MGVQRIERTDLWKNNARILQLRLRDRFRVAVDSHHRRRLLSGEGYFSSIVQRWLTRFRDFRRDTLQSTAVFYRKRVSKDFKTEEDSVIFRMLQSVAVPLLGNMCYVFMNGLNRIQVYGLEKLHDALLNRPKNKSLLTVSNHVASVDDPFVIASLLPPRVLLDAQNLRWTLCATDRCFTNPVTSAFFRSVKVLPVSRGDGIYQKGMDMAIAKLNSGGWVHIFPEGSRSRDGGKTIGAAKRGVGRLILDADKVPLVIPFVHIGMQEIMPIGGKLPRIGKTVTVLIGDPIHFDDLLTEDVKEESRGQLYDAVASRIGQRLRELKTQVEELSERECKLQQSKTGSSERASEILQQVDWDAFGIGSQILREYRTTTDVQQQTVRNPPSNREFASSDRYFRAAYSSNDGMITKMRSHMDSTELMSFAARGLFANQKGKETVSSIGTATPLGVWKQFWEANVCQQWSPC